MLDIRVLRGGKVISENLALNDAVISNGSMARVAELDVYADGELITNFTGDGVIVATPTGSTAYNISAGGPIVEPEANNIIITPICSHDVGARCIVASGKRMITTQIVRNARRNAFLSVDGGKAIRLNMGDVTTVKKSNLETKLVRLKDRSFFDVVNTKFKIN